MTQATETFLEHFGVKGMKWGVRKDNGHEGERVKTKQLKKLDKKWEKENTGVKGWVKVHNAAAQKMNDGEIDRINSKPEYEDAANKGILNNMSHPITRKYHAEMEDAFNDAFLEAGLALGTNPSGTKKYVLKANEDGSREALLVPTGEVRHSAEDAEPVYRVPMDKQGRFLKLIQDDNVEHWDMAGAFLEHYGVKGMKWGVHREKTAQEVTTKTAPGRKVKTAGGKHHGPADDAIKAAKIRQQAKKSTTDSLSNKELQDLITRMNLENQYKNLNANNVSAGKKVLRFLTGQVGDKEVNQLADFASDSRGRTSTDKKGNRVNDPKTAFAVKAGVAGAKALAGNGNGGKKK